ncbi:hypothetical protein [Photobacterium kishitanii]|uniref:Spermidine synthase n=1 Tax=Photobacterium kishitanii TaxID=318456 RepID=A0A2T3KLN6_9GAMM|nr:hypothetical protein [Photobacterium kishitanii]PSV00601.1 hypothetical protein C9J27_05550 [Photobacterium kishitanii]
MSNFIKKIYKHFGKLPSVPSYVEVDRELSNNWSIKTFDFSKSGYSGYFSARNDVGTGVALLENGSAMMSITPLELESMLLPYSYAHGKVVVAGLGLGLIALNLLRKPKVKQLIVLERDEVIASNFESFLSGSSLTLWKENIASGRVKVVIADCQQHLEPMVLDSVRDADYMWCDIWLELFTSEALPDVQFLQSQVKAKVCDYWGMELDLFSHMVKSPGVVPTHNVKKIEWDILKAIETFDLPISPKKFDKSKSSVFAMLVMIIAKNSEISRRLAKKDALASKSPL